MVFSIVSCMEIRYLRRGPASKSPKNLNTAGCPLCSRAPPNHPPVLGTGSLLMLVATTFRAQATQGGIWLGFEACHGSADPFP